MAFKLRPLFSPPHIRPGPFLAIHLADSDKRRKAPVRFGRESNVERDSVLYERKALTELRVPG